MRILVTGGAGFIGSHVVDACLEGGHAVAVVDNLSTGHERNLHPAARFFQVDIRDGRALRQVFADVQPEVVIHHAAHVSVRNSVRQPLLDAEVNVLGSINVLECAREVGTRKVIYSSSGGTVYGEPKNPPCTEDYPIQPLSPYGASKYIIEHYLHLYWQNHGLAYTILRYGNVYGPRQDPEGEAGVIAIFVLLMLQGNAPTIYGDGEQVRDYIYVGDCASANLRVLRQGDGRIYNIGTGIPTTVNQLFHTLQPLTRFSGIPHYTSPKKGDIYRTYLDITRAQRELGWEPMMSLGEGLIHTISSFEKNNN
jgi:UDP-glucose 4-epimerase